MSIITNVSRRAFLGGSATVLLAPALIGRASAQVKSITITSYGGTFQDTLQKTVLEPFTNETGIKVNVVPVPDIAKIKAQSLTRNVDLDVVMTAHENAALGKKLGLWDELDLGKLDVQDMAIAPEKVFVTASSFAGGVAWDPAKHGDAHPKNFAEYFDTAKFPGRRTLPNRPAETLEAALLADGVAPKDIYPLDVDRAFKALDRIKANIATWVTATPQTISLVQTGEVDYSYSYANRVKATNAPGGGTPLAFSFDQNLIGTEKLAIPKGAPNKEGAMAYIAYYLKPEVMARLSNAAFITPNSKAAVAKLDAEVKKWTPDLTSPNNVVIDGEFWTNNLEPIARRFKEWVLS